MNSTAVDIRSLFQPHRVTKHRSTWSEPPRKVPCNTATDAPLLGNGDLGVCIGGPPEDQGYWIAKNDFWKMRSRHDSTGVRMFGTLRISVPCLQGASYHVEQGQPCIVFHDAGLPLLDVIGSPLQARHGYTEHSEHPHPGGVVSRSHLPEVVLRDSVALILRRTADADAQVPVAEKRCIRGGVARHLPRRLRPSASVLYYPVWLHVVSLAEPGTSRAARPYQMFRAGLRSVICAPVLSTNPTAPNFIAMACMYQGATQDASRIHMHATPEVGRISISGRVCVYRAGTGVPAYFRYARHA